MAMFHRSFAGRDLGPLLAPYHSRATTAATDKGVDGVLRVVDRSPNALKYTDDLGNAFWIKRGVVATANALAMSVGTRKMSLIQGLGAFGVGDVYFNLSAVGVTGAPIGVSFRINKASATGTIGVINTNSGTAGEWHINLALVEAGEQRITKSHPAVTVVAPMVLHSYLGGSGGLLFLKVNGAGGDLYLGGVQHQVGVTDPNFTEYFHAGDNSRPAFDGADGLLLEGARTNLLTRSQEFEHADWVAVNSVVSSNSIAAPDGTTTADFVRSDATAGATHRLYHDVTLSAGANSFTCYVKAAGITWIALRTTGGALSYFNIGAGVVGVKSGSHTSSRIDFIGNGWYRCQVVWTSAGGATALGVDLATADNTNTYNGDSSSGAYFWGAQVELGAFASSYIPTTSAAVLRARSQIESLPLANLGIASQQQEYSIAVAFKVPAAEDVTNGHLQPLIRIKNSNNDYLVVWYTSQYGETGVFRYHGGGYIGGSNYAGLAVVAGDTIFARVSVSAITGMIAVASKGGANAVNSAASVNEKALFPAALTTLELGWNYGNGLFASIKGVRVWDRALSQAELLALKADMFDIPETGLLTRKPTNSLTKLLTRPMAA